MSLDPISLCAVGMILTLAGGGLFVQALVSRKKAAAWWPPVTAGALLVGLSAGLVAFRFEAWIVASSLVLGVAGLSMGLLRSSMLAWTARLLARPITQAG